MSFSFGSIPSQTSTNTATLGTWDKAVLAVPIRSHINGERCDFKTFTSHPDYSDFSLEEHRLEDYKNSKGRNAMQIASSDNENSLAPDSELLTKKTLVDRNKMELLQGRGVEIQVGTKTTSPSRSGTKSFETWCLPMNLVSHYSPYVKEIYSSSFQEPYGQLTLQDHQPGIFSLFVEWLYYGCYHSFSAVSNSSIDAQCWILGNKLLCIDFQNYAMRRLYDQYTRPMLGRPMTCDDVRYIWANTSSGSKLRKFYMNFIVEHFGSQVKLLGSSTDWDIILQNQSEIRISLLDKLRQSTSSSSRVENVNNYLESNSISWSLPLQRTRQPAPLASGANMEEAPMFNGNEEPGEIKDSPQKTESSQIATKTKNYEGAVLKFKDNTDTSSSCSSEITQSKHDFPADLKDEPLKDEPLIGNANQCITYVSKSDVVRKSS